MNLSNFKINKNGFAGYTNFRVYCSEETHSSIEKGVKILGVGKANLVKIPTDDNLAMQSNLLYNQIQHDINKGFIPLCVIAAIGTTGTLAIDPLDEIIKITNKFNIWLHVDAAYAGSAFLLPEYQKLISGLEYADSLVFNPHKWLFTNFDCSIYFVKNKEALVNTFSILPEYLKTQTDGLVNNHCDWGIPLGRRFRSLKLWFVLRHYGLKGLREKISYHIDLAIWLENKINNSTEFELAVPRCMNLVCFYYVPSSIENITKDEQNDLNERLLYLLNEKGKIYLTHTKVNQYYTLRMSIGQTNVEKHHVVNAWNLIKESANEIFQNRNDM